jgi:uncharacterized protein YukE
MNREDADREFAVAIHQLQKALYRKAGMDYSEEYEKLHESSTHQKQWNSMTSANIANITDRLSSIETLITGLVNSVSRIGKRKPRATKKLVIKKRAAKK